MTLLKEKITFGTIMGVVREYFVMTIGILLYTFAWIACILPAHGTGGGATGAALVLCGAIENLFNFQINIGTMAFIVNGILLLFAGFIIGWNFGIKTIFCIIVLPASLNFFQETLPGVQAWLAELGVIAPDAISLFGNLEPLLLVIMGGMLSGVGIYMCLRQGGSTGGTDIVALLINKYHPINYGRVVLVTDSLIICSSLLVGNGIETVIYGFLLTAVFGLSTDALLAGNQQSNQILVISHEHDRIAAEIVEKAHRGDDAQRHGMVYEGVVAGSDGHLPQTRNGRHPQDRPQPRPQGVRFGGFRNGCLRTGLRYHRRRYAQRYEEELGNLL